MLFAGTNTLPVPFHAVVLTAFSFKILLPPFKTPAVSVTIPVKVCVNPTPKFKVPAAALIVNVPPVIFPTNVAVPEALVNVTAPVVLKSSIDCVAVVPAMVTPPVLAVKVPLFV